MKNKGEIQLQVVAPSMCSCGQAGAVLANQAIRAFKKRKKCSAADSNSECRGAQDIEGVDPEYYKNLTWLLEHDMTDVVDLNFVEEVDYFGRVEHVELKPGGRDIKVRSRLRPIAVCAAQGPKTVASSSIKSVCGISLQKKILCL